MFENDTISSGEHRRDFLLIAAVILAAAAAVFFFQVKNKTSGTVYAIVEQDSKELMRLPLSEPGEYRISDGDSYNVIEITEWRPDEGSGLPGSDLRQPRTDSEKRTEYRLPASSACHPSGTGRRSGIGCGSGIK